MPERRRQRIPSCAVLVAALLASAPAALAADAAVPGAAAAPAAGGPVATPGGPGFAELARTAPAVVRARVIRRESRRDHRGLIVTDTRFTVEEVVAGGGAPGGELTLTTLGGALGGQELSVSHMPRFEPGLGYVVFIDPRRGTYDPVVGNEAGVFRVGPEGEMLTYAGREVLGVEGGALRLGPGRAWPGDAGPPRGSGGVTVEAEASLPASPEVAAAAAMDAAAFARAIRSLR